MTTETILPTPQRIAKAGAYYQPPQVDQETNRRHGRVKPAFEHLHNTDQISYAQCQAGEKFETHWYGAQGVDVRYGSDSGGERLEYAQTYHAQMLAKAMKEIGKRQSTAMQMLIEGHSINAVGHALAGYQDRRQQGAYAIALIQEATERLSELWGFKSRHHPPSR